MHLLLNRGDGTLSDRPAGLGGTAVALADLNQDGRPDVVLGDERGRVTVLIQTSP